MATSSSAHRRFTRCLVLTAAALLLLSSPASARSATESASPEPRPAPPQSVLDRPGVQARPLPGAAPPPHDVSASSWLVADAGTGEVLAARDAHRKLPPASTLKSLFALTALPQLDATARHKVSERDLAGVGEGSSLVGVVPGRSYRVADLWRGVFLSSGNDAVHVLTAMIGGKRAAVRQMQAKAGELGAHDTHVVSPDGYDAPGQVSSAYDLAVFGLAGLADTEFARYCSTSSARFPGEDGGYAIRNTNRLLTGADGVHRYGGLIGIKNGYTTEAGNTLIAAARRGSRTILVTVMNPRAERSHAVYEEARSLLDWGFSSADRARPVGTLTFSAKPGPPSARPAAVPVARAGGPLGPGLWAIAACGAVSVAGGTLLGVRRKARASASDAV